MEKKEINERCEICLNFIPEDKSRHILKNLAAKNPGNKEYYELAARQMGLDPSASSVMGTCHVSKERVKETELCDEFLHDISKTY